MKFTLKALAASVVLATALPANAALDTAASGNSSLILTLLDRVANVSASFDLGKNYFDFNLDTNAGAKGALTADGSTQSWNLTTGDYGTAWSTYFSSGATAANTFWAITAADNLGAATNGQRGVLGTYVGNGSQLSSSGLVTQAGNFDTYIGNIGFTPINVFANHDTVANGANVSNGGAALGSTFYPANNTASNRGPITMSALGSTVGLVQQTRVASVIGTVNQFVAPQTTFNLAANGTLAYNAAPVPEAETSAMLMLGLGLMGFVARRKTKA